MKKEELIDKYLKISIELHNNLETLENLNKEKQEIIEFVAKKNELNKELENKIKESIKKYEDLAKKSKELRTQSEQIKETLIKMLSTKEEKALFSKVKKVKY